MHLKQEGILITKVGMFHEDDGYDLVLMADYDQRVAYVCLQTTDGVPPEFMYALPYEVYAHLLAFSCDPLKSRVPYRNLDNKH